MRPHRWAASAMICMVGALLTSYSEPESGQKEGSNQLPTLHPPDRPKPLRPVYRRSAVEVARLIHRICLGAVDESASVHRFEAILKESQLKPVPAPGHGRMTVWHVPGAEVSYANSPKGGRAESILCLLDLDYRGVPEAGRVAKALEPLIGRGRPEVGRMVGPDGHPGFRWTFSNAPDVQTVVKVADVPEAYWEGEGYVPKFLAVHVVHLGGANTR